MLFWTFTGILPPYLHFCDTKTFHKTEIKKPNGCGHEVNTRSVPEMENITIQHLTETSGA